MTITDCIDQNIKALKSGSAASPNTIRTYRGFRDIYNHWAKPLVVTPKTSAARYISHFEDLKRSLAGRYSNSTISAIINLCVSSLRRVHYLSVPRIQNVKLEQKPITVLEPEFVREFLSDTPKYNSFCKKYMMMWEVCAIMMATSLRISDVVSLGVSNFVIRDGAAFLNKKNIKTGAYTTVPLPGSLSRILFCNIQNGYVLTPSSITPSPMSIRRLIRPFFENYTYMHKVVVCADGVVKKYYEVVHPHMLRRTAITSMLVGGVSREHVMFASGHRPGSRSFERYVGFVESAYRSEIEAYNKTISA